MLGRCNTLERNLGPREKSEGAPGLHLGGSCLCAACCRHLMTRLRTPQPLIHTCCVCPAAVPPPPPPPQVVDLVQMLDVCSSHFNPSSSTPAVCMCPLPSPPAPPKKQVVDLVQTLDGGRRNMYDPDEIEEEQREREKRNKINADFKQFTTRVQVCGVGGGEGVCGGVGEVGQQASSSPHACRCGGVGAWVPGGGGEGGSGGAGVCRRRGAASSSHGQGWSSYRLGRGQGWSEGRMEEREGRSCWGGGPVLMSTILVWISPQPHHLSHFTPPSPSSVNRGYTGPPTPAPTQLTKCLACHGLTVC